MGKTLYNLLPTHHGYSTVLADMDFETYSEAGYVIDPHTRKVSALVPKYPGIQGVGAPVYAKHPSTEVLCLAYDLKDGKGPRLWKPGDPPPHDLFEFFAEGNIASAWNSIFEYLIWENVCVPKMGWPAIEPWQIFDIAVKARYFGLPSSLANAGDVLDIANKKLKKEGDQVLRRFSIPRTPTKKDPRSRIYPAGDPLEQTLYNYNQMDIKAEEEINNLLPDLEPFEYEVWRQHTNCNLRGVHVDAVGVEDCISIVEQATARHTCELYAITAGAVSSHDELKNMGNWLQLHGVDIPNLQAETVSEWINRLPDGSPQQRVLIIRSKLASAAVKKLYAIRARKDDNNRLLDLFRMYGADRTGRWSALGVQPHNLANNGPKVIFCENGCGHYYGAHNEKCPWCGAASFLNPDPVKWSINAVENTLEVISWRDLDTVELFFGDALDVVTGCIRGLITAADGNDIICSDYKSIEAVTMAEMAGETWRQEVFRTHGRIYEMTASMLSGIPLEEILNYKKNHGVHHPLREMGKTAELSGQYASWIGGWKVFGADQFFPDDEALKQAILLWRSKSPRFVDYWKAMEQCFTQAVLNPQGRYSYNGVHFGMMENKLFIGLPSGRKLIYHEPEAVPYVDEWGRDKHRLSYMQWNTDPKQGQQNAWIRVGTWRGKITENTIQAIARDALAYLMVQLEKHGYPVVLHVHDQPGSEVPKGFGSIEEFESISRLLPAWCAGWPIKLVDGWRGKRFRKG